MEDIVSAPFTLDQVKSINGYQKSGVFHPFTCGSGDQNILKATESGFVCDECTYTQNWAHVWMADWTWVSGLLMKYLINLSTELEKKSSSFNYFYN